ncbi:hypothetical protein BEL04_18900 [Mucilaginibacter sp. PPCGB 2223]|nr:hypothetical protein BEL04_18900 [Mucilaginibacter sp. PPCGB 2223]
MFCLAALYLKAQSTFFDLAPSGTLTTTGTNFSGGAIGRNFSALTSLQVGQSLTVDLGASLPVSVVTFGSWFAADSRFIPVGYTIEHSNDAATWTTDVTVTSNTSLNPAHNVNLSARYWRLTVTAVQSGQTYVSISGFELVSSGSGGAIGTNLWNTRWVGENIFTNSAVSIGTTDQVALLTLNSPAGANMILQNAGANIAGLSVNSTSSTWNGGGGISLNMVATNADINFQTGSPAATTMVVKNNGNVAIGTTTPYAGAKFQTRLNTNVNLGIDGGTGSGSVRLDAYNDASSANIPLELQGSTISLYSNSGTLGLFVNSSGNVAIGTTDPKGYKLAVAGDGIAESMTVDLQANWPDYVFKKDFSLPTLAKLKAYIDQNQHLPEVPTAGQLAKTGINLGQMNTLLMKKVEELTLYLIEKDKQDKEKEALLQSQQKQIDELKQQMASMMTALQQKTKAQ